jgi:O-methyltransferase
MSEPTPPTHPDLVYRIVAIARKYLAPILPLRSQAFGRTRIADMAVRHVAGIEGAYLEFGVYRGSTFSTFYHLFKKYRHEVPMWAFDSFEGLPAMTRGDSGAWYEGQYSCDVNSFISFIKKWGVPEGAFSIVAGFFNESLSRSISIEKAAIIWIDCDLYNSTVSVLRFIKPMLQDGTLVLFDDFGGTDDQGERRALIEFLQANPDVKFNPWKRFHTKGQAFEVKT